MAYAVRQFVILWAAVALESTRERNEAGHLFHHPVGHVAEALLADGARFKAFGLARAAHDVPFAALDDRTGYPVMTYWAVEQAYQSIVVDQSPVGAVAQYRLARRHILAGLDVAALSNQSVG